jgi:hypothetical protein
MANEFAREICQRQFCVRVFGVVRGSPQRRRRGIFVEPQPKHNSRFLRTATSGATYSDDVAPTELLFVFELLIYKDVSPTGFEKLNPCFIRVHPWLKNFRVVRVVPAFIHFLRGKLFVGVEVTRLISNTGC